MKQRDHLLNLAIGSGLLMVLNGTILKFNDSNNWIPIATIFGCFGVLALVLRSAINGIKEQLRNVEEQKHT